MKRKRQIGLVGLSLAVLALVWVAHPFATVVVGGAVGRGVFREMSYLRIYLHITQNCTKDSTRTLALFRFVSQHMGHPRSNTLPADVPPLEALATGYGSCDQQAEALKTLAEVGGLRGTVCYLYKGGPESVHAVALIEVDGGPHMFDSYFGFTDFTRSGNIELLMEVDKNQSPSTLDTTGLPIGYFDMIEPVTAERFEVLHRPVPWPRRVLRLNLKLWLWAMGPRLANHYFESGLLPFAADDAERLGLLLGLKPQNN